MQTLGLEYESCPVMKAFRTMSDLPIQSELSQIKNEAEMYLAHLASKQNKKFEMSVWIYELTVKYWGSSEIS